MKNMGQFYCLLLTGLLLLAMVLLSSLQPSKVFDTDSTLSYLATASPSSPVESWTATTYRPNTSLFFPFQDEARRYLLNIVLIKGERQILIGDIQQDTGSDISILPRALMGDLGVTPAQGTPAEVYGIVGVVRGYLYDLLMMVVVGNECLSKDGIRCYLFEAPVLLADVPQEVRLLGRRGVDDKLDFDVGSRGITVTVKPDAPPSQAGPVQPSASPSSGSQGGLDELLPREILGYKLNPCDISATIRLLEANGVNVEEAVAVEGSKESAITAIYGHTDSLEVEAYDLAMPRDAEQARRILKAISEASRPAQPGACQCSATSTAIVCTVEHWKQVTQEMNEVKIEYRINSREFWTFAPHASNPWCDSALPSQWIYSGSAVWTMNDLAFAANLSEQYAEGNFSHFQEGLQEIARVIIGKAQNR